MEGLMPFSTNSFFVKLFLQGEVSESQLTSLTSETAPLLKNGGVTTWGICLSSMVCHLTQELRPRFGWFPMEMASGISVLIWNFKL
jgi:hypothetical protein